MVRILTLLLFSASAGGLSRSASAAPPWHSWMTVPLYWWGSSPYRAYDSQTAAYAVSHPVVITNGNYMCHATGCHGGEEQRLVGAATMLAALNSSTSQFFYMNSMINWQQYDLHSFLANQHPEWLAVNMRGQTVCLDGQTIFNLSVSEMRSHWLGTVSRCLATGLFAGVFADRAGPPLPRSTHTQQSVGQPRLNGVLNASGSCVSPPDGLPPFEYADSAYTAWAAGHSEMLLAAQRQATEEIIVVANNNATAGVRGRHFERWAHKDFDKLTIAADIATLQQAGANGQIALVHGGEPCDRAAFSLSLAAFLIGASSKAYFACTDGWLLSQGWEKSQRFQEYDFLLGEPRGPAVQTRLPGGIRYERSFGSGTNVTLELQDGATAAGTGCIYWAEGAITGGLNCKRHRHAIKLDDEAHTVSPGSFKLPGGGGTLTVLKSRSNPVIGPSGIAGSQDYCGARDMGIAKTDSGLALVYSGYSNCSMGTYDHCGTVGCCQLMFSTLTIDESRDSTSKATRTGTVLPAPPATDFYPLTTDAYMRFEPATSRWHMWVTEVPRGHAPNNCQGCRRQIGHLTVAGNASSLPTHGWSYQSDTVFHPLPDWAPYAIDEPRVYPRTDGARGGWIMYIGSQGNNDEGSPTANSWCVGYATADQLDGPWTNGPGCIIGSGNATGYQAEGFVSFSYNDLCALYLRD